ncbi:MAG: HAD family hydrolase [Verrucomicrobia bacterium]|nr:HAD family hydrolase [Verrucomicrobiota bacterium]
MTTLLLWDIDGTLTLSGGAGMRALQSALAREFGIDRSLADIDYAGRTDRHIVGQIFARCALPDTPAGRERLLDAYLAELPAALNNPGTRVLPGIRELVPQLATRADCVLALLTGNIERGARIKLGHHGLSDYFGFGAFADDSPVRNDLGPVALRRARERLGVEFAADRVFVIGDTPHDIECGKVIGARTVAVATGQYSLAELQRHQPAFCFADFSDTAEFLRAVGLSDGRG